MLLCSSLSELTLQIFRNAKLLPIPCLPFPLSSPLFLVWTLSGPKQEGCGAEVAHQGRDLASLPSLEPPAGPGLPLMWSTEEGRQGRDIPLIVP